MKYVMFRTSFLTISKSPRDKHVKVFSCFETLNFPLACKFNRLLKYITVSFYLFFMKGNLLFKTTFKSKVCWFDRSKFQIWNYKTNFFKSRPPATPVHLMRIITSQIRKTLVWRTKNLKRKKKNKKQKLSTVIDSHRFAKRVHGSRYNTRVYVKCGHLPFTDADCNPFRN